MTEDLDENGSDICRVCRTEATSDKPLYHPCLCTGSIKFVHQDCLTQWLKYSRKEFCELCNHKYTFMPIYHPDMPKRLPVREFLWGLVSNLARAVRFWFHYTLVAVAWLGVVPLTACRIYRCLFRGSVNSLLTLPLDMLSTDNLLGDCLQGAFIIVLTLCAFVSLVWLREQIIHGGPPQWLNLDINNGNNNRQQQQQQAPVARAEADHNAAVAALAAAVAEGQVDENAPVADEAQQPLPAPPVPPQPAENFQNNNQQEAAQDDNNWQPFEWDRAAEELTWERLLGLDGSLVFLEHVFWVISLNTLFIVVFAFSPFHVGHFVATSLKLTPYVRATCFDGLMTTLIGYFIIGFVLYILHTTCRMFKFKRAHRIVGMCYLVVKVFLLVLMEIGIFPLVCGCWLDVCSLLLFSASLKDRINSFQTAPGTSAFLHWLVGMVYVFYFASFVLLLREVLRPGVLWFLRNLNDPEFNPIQEMIQFPVYRHIRRFVASLIMFGLTIMLIVYYPIRIILKCKPSVLPYNIHLNNLNSTVYLNIETSLSELSLELLLLQVVLPALLEQSHARHALKVVVKYWCIVMSRVLGLTEYLLPAEDLIQRDRNHNLFNQQQGNGPAIAGNNEGLPPPAEPGPLVQPPVNNPRLDHHGGNLGAEHQALLLGGRGSTAFQPYNKPTWFAFRIVALLVCLALSALIASLICLTVPGILVMLGRQVIYLLTGHQQTHELYTMACGLYLCWLTLRLTFLFVEYIPWGWSTILASSKFWASIIFKCALVALAVLGAIPMLFGILFQLVVVAPLRVGADQSPLFFPWQDWAMGILHCKIICALIMMGPEWHLKRVFDRVIYQDGFRGLNVRYVYLELIIPTVTVAGLVIAIPYISAHSVLPMFGFSKEDEVVFQRHIYPCLLLITIVVTFLVWQFKQLKSLLIRIRNERYLVGQRLVNYERTVAAAAAAAAANTTLT